MPRGICVTLDLWKIADEVIDNPDTAVGAKSTPMVAALMPPSALRNPVKLPAHVCDDRNRRRGVSRGTVARGELERVHRKRWSGRLVRTRDRTSEKTPGTPCGKTSGRTSAEKFAVIGIGKSKTGPQPHGAVAESSPPIPDTGRLLAFLCAQTQRRIVTEAGGDRRELFPN